MIETWEAEGFEIVLEKGRPKPLVLSCEQWSEDGDVLAKERFAVKAMGMPGVTTESMRREVIGNFIAHKLGVDTPRPVLVQISKEFCDAITPSLKPYGLKLQPGIGVGCEFIPGMAPIIPNSEKTPRELYDAQRMFAVDQILQNPERHSGHTNAGALANGFIAYGFEKSLHFLSAPADFAPWELSKVHFDKPHLFHAALRGKKSDAYDWSGFVQDIANFNVQELSDFIDSLPADWDSERQQICKHMASIVGNDARLEWQLRESLA
ncbi:MAG: HipA family kinase [Capsulimonas sp.]|uniref:HipA family kinase n=1 Tax=Capsulimonas sp. TaxID=2494211 RepID=UPI0032637C03